MKLVEKRLVSLRAKTILYSTLINKALQAKQVVIHFHFKTNRITVFSNLTLQHKYLHHYMEQYKLRRDLRYRHNKKEK